MDHCTAAIFGGALISVLVTPMEGVKARLQVQYSDRGTGGAAVRAQGIGPGPYKGVVLTHVMIVTQKC